MKGSNRVKRGNTRKGLTQRRWSGKNSEEVRPEIQGAERNFLTEEAHANGLRQEACGVLKEL